MHLVGVRTSLLNFSPSSIWFSSWRREDLLTHIKASKLPVFLLWSWWLVPQDSGYQSDNRLLDAFMYIYGTSPEAESQVWMKQSIIDEIGAENWLSKLIRSIKENERLVGDILGNSLWALDAIASWQHPEIVRAVGRLPVTAALAYALKNKDGSSRPYPIEQRQPDMSLTHLYFRRWISCAHLLE